MIEIIILDYLNANLSVPAVMEREKNAPDRFVVLEKTSGGERNHVSSATFAFQSYSKTSMFEAAELNEELKHVVKNMIELDGIASVKLNSDYNFTDTSTKEYRYQAVFDFKY